MVCVGNVVVAVDAARVAVVGAVVYFVVVAVVGPGAVVVVLWAPCFQSVCHG